MSKELILKMCQEIVEGKQTEENGFDCIGIYCEDCPIGRFNNNGISCHDNTEENIIAAAKKYIAENTEFDWEEFKNGSIAVHCDTEEKAKDFLKKCDKRDIKWSFGEGTIKGNNRWNCYKEKTCYSWYFEGIIFENIDKEDLKIIKWEIKGKKEMKNKFKVGDKVKKINGDLFGEFRDKPHKVVTIEKIDDYSIWFKETRTNLAFCDIDEIEKVTENKTKLTFKEFVNEAEEGKIYVSRMGVEFYKEYKNIKIKLPDGVKTNKLSIPVDSILTLKKKEYKFTEAIEKAREGNIIMSLVSREFYSPVEIENGKDLFELNEIEGKWSVED